ncbi:MAG: hypothetical protein LBN33_07885 [Desulfovibrio sp.]|jgi:hypothetical protein|nr:hypothetical protein [Desulfovibrio sp.]
MLSNYISYLFELIIKRGNAFTCCAACGELSLPVKKRFCSSLTPEWECDAVLIGNWPREGLRMALRAIELRMPWVRSVFVQADAVDIVSDRIQFLPKGMDEAHLYSVESLAEYFIVMWSGWLPAAPLCRVDFFTPNGLLLLFVDTEEQEIQGYNFVQLAAGRTKTLSAIFEQSRRGMELPAATKYAEALTGFAYAERYGILADAGILNG